MRKLMLMITLLAVLLAMAAPAWADSPGVEVITGWVAGSTGFTVCGTLGSGNGAIGIPTRSIPADYQGKPDSIGAIEAAFKANSTGVEHALGTFNSDVPIAYSSDLINYMTRMDFNPAVVGGPNITPGSVTPAMMPNGYLLIDKIGSDGWAVQLIPGQTPAALAGAVNTSAQQTVQTKPTPQEAAVTSPSIPAPGKGSSAPQALTKDQQTAAALHVPVSYVTNPPAVHYPTKPAAKPFPWQWVYIGGGVSVLLAAVAVVIRRRRKEYGGVV